MRRFAASLQGSLEMRKSLAVVLAAGEGKRMKSRLPKALHEIGRLPMIAHVLRTLNDAGVDRIAVVVGPGHEAVAKIVEANASGASIHTQPQRRGTGDAVKAARFEIEAGTDDVLVVYADSPFITAEAIKALRAPLAEEAAVVVGGMRPKNP